MPFELKINGLCGLLCTVKADTSWNVRDLKIAIQEAVHIYPSDQTLLYGDGKLEDDMFQDMDGSTDVTLIQSAKEHSAGQFIADGGYQIVKKIGSGRFADVYRGIDHFYDRQVAIKVERAGMEPPQLFREVDVLKSLHMPVSPQGFTQIYYYGGDTIRDSKYLIMELLGRSLEDVSEMNQGHLSAETVVVIAEQVLCRIEYLHSKCIVHCDIKPQQFLFGCKNKMQQLYLVDFGLSSRYWGTRHMPMRNHVLSLTGAARYASINAHRGIQQSRRDDLESIGYMFMQLLRGHLPWPKLREITARGLWKIMDTKEKVTLSELCAGFPDEFKQYLSYARSLGYQSRPDYHMLRKLFCDFQEQYGLREQPFRSSRVFSECFGNHSWRYDGPLDPLVIPCDIAQPDDDPRIASATQDWSVKAISGARFITPGLARVTAAALSSLRMNS